MTNTVPVPKSVSSISAIEYAAMSRDVYDKDDTALYHFLHECGWQRVITLPNAESKEFRARLYKRISDGMMVLAYRGTEFTRLSNLEADIKLAIKKPSDFLVHAEKAYYAICERYGTPIALTGHSLGGYLSQYISIIFNDEKIKTAIKTNSDTVIQHDHPHAPYAITFNAPHVGGLHHKKLDFVIESGGDRYYYVINYGADSDLISKIGKRVGYMDSVTTPGFCSLDQLQNRKTAITFLTKTFPQARTIGQGVSAVDYAACGYQEHKIDMLIARLWADASIYKEKLGIPLAPKDVIKHEHESLLAGVL